MKSILLQSIKKRFNILSLVFFFTTPLIFLGSFFAEFILNSTFSIKQYYIILSLLFILLLILVLSVFLFIKKEFDITKIRVLALILFLFLIFVFSIIYRYSVGDISYDKAMLSELISMYPYFYVKTTDFFQDNEKYSRVKAYIIAFTDYKKVVKTKISIFFYSDSFFELASGNIYLFNSEILKKYTPLNYLEEKSQISLSRIDAVKKIREGNFINRLRYKIRLTFIEKINKYYDRWNSGNIYAILTGSKQFIYQPLLEAFRATGTSHLFALSGQHLSILLLLVGVLTSNSVVLIFFSLLYLAFAGWQISFLRAFYSLIIAIIVRQYKIKPYFENIISILTLLVFISEPRSILSISFFLSLTAISALFSVFSFSNQIKKKFMKVIILPFLTSLDIFIFQFPLLASYFSSINILSPIINLIAIPLFCFAVYFAIFSLLINPFLIFSSISSGILNSLSIFLLITKRLKIFTIYIELPKFIGFFILFLIFSIHYFLLRISINPVENIYSLEED